MKLKELIENLQSFEDQEKEVFIFYDEFEDQNIIDARYDERIDAVVISNYKLSSKQYPEMKEIKTVQDLINELLKIEDRTKIIEVNAQFAIENVQVASDRVNIVTTE